MSQPLFEHHLRLAGFDTRVLELEGDGPPLLLLHGYADSADTWRHVLARVAQAERRALAVDLPGFGAASRLHATQPILPQLDRFAAAAVEHLAADGGQVIVAGNSLGGCVALRLGERDGGSRGRAHEALAGVVPIAPAGLDMPRWFNAVERDPIVRTLLALPFPLPEPIVRAAVGQAYRNLAFARPRAVPAEVISAFTSHHRDRRTVSRTLSTARRLLPELREPFALEQVSVPVLLIWGDRDRMVTHHGASRVTEALPETTYELIAGCGHCPQIEAPERVTELLLSFAAERADAPAA